MDDASYITEKLHLEQGDSILLYTDGVTEAMNDKYELFSNNRLENMLFKLQNESIQEIIKKTVKEIHYFAEGVPQSDDITMMMIEFKGWIFYITNPILCPHPRRGH